MKIKYLLLIIVFVFGFTNCRFSGIKGNGDFASEQREIDNFDRLDLSGAFLVKVKIGNSTDLKIESDRNLLKYIKTVVKGNTLEISSKKDLRPKKKIVIYITTPELNDVSVSGANDLFVNGLKNDEFFVNLSGAGSVNVEGETDDLQVSISGAANLNAKDLIAENVSIDISGAADAEVYANESLNATVSGVGNVVYYGNPKSINPKVSGVGSIKKK